MKLQLLQITLCHSSDDANAGVRLRHYERMCALKSQFIFHSFIFDLCSTMQKGNFCVFFHVKELVTPLSVNGFLSAITPTFSVYPPSPSGNLMLKYVSKDI